MCVLSSHLFWTSGLWTYQPGSRRRKVTQDFSSAFVLLRRLPSFFSREGFSQVFLSLVDREGEFGVLTNYSSFSTRLVGHFLFLFFVRKNPSSCDDTEIRTHNPTSEGFEVTNWTTEATDEYELKILLSGLECCQYHPRIWTTISYRERLSGVLLIQQSHQKRQKKFSVSRRVTRRQVMRHFTSNGTDQCRNGSSNLLTSYREQPRSTWILKKNLNASRPYSESPTHGQRSQQQSGPITLQSVLTSKLKFSKAAHHAEMKISVIPRSIAAMDAFRWWSWRTSQHAAVQSPLCIPEKHSSNLSHSPLLVGPPRKQRNRGPGINSPLRNLPVRAFDSRTQGFGTLLAHRRSSCSPPSPNPVLTYPIERATVRAAAPYQALCDSSLFLSHATFNTIINTIIIPPEGKGTELELWKDAPGEHHSQPTTNQTTAASQLTAWIAKTASSLHLLKVIPALHPSDKLSPTYTPKPGLGGRAHEVCTLMYAV